MKGKKTVPCRSVALDGFCSQRDVHNEISGVCHQFAEPVSECFPFRGTLYFAIHRVTANMAVDETILQLFEKRVKCHNS